MSMCWWCHWGWPKPIADIYIKAVKDLGGFLNALHFGPSHIVWEDENWDCAQWCLDHFDEYGGDYDEEELAIVRRSLEELLLVPDEYKEWPAEYDGNNPGQFPPPAHWTMIHAAWRRGF